MLEDGLDHMVRITVKAQSTDFTQQLFNQIPRRTTSTTKLLPFFLCKKGSTKMRPRAPEKILGLSLLRFLVEGEKPPNHKSPEKKMPQKTKKSPFSPNFPNFPKKKKTGRGPSNDRGCDRLVDFFAARTAKCRSSCATRSLAAAERWDTIFCTLAGCGRWLVGRRCQQAMMVIPHKMPISYGSTKLQITLKKSLTMEVTENDGFCKRNLSFFQGFIWKRLKKFHVNKLNLGGVSHIQIFSQNEAPFFCCHVEPTSKWNTLQSLTYSQGLYSSVVPPALVTNWVQAPHSCHVGALTTPTHSPEFKWATTQKKLMPVHWILVVL